MKPLTTLALLALLLTAAAIFSFQGDSSASPLLEERLPGPAAKATPVPGKRTPVTTAAPGEKLKAAKEAPSPLQLELLAALQAGDLCATAKILNERSTPRELWGAILGAIHPSPALAEAFGSDGPLLAEQPPAGPSPGAHKITKVLWALKLGGMLSAPSVTAEDPSRALALWKTLEAADSSNGFYALFRLSLEEKAGAARDRLTELAESAANASSFESPYDELEREIREAQFLNPALHYAIQWTYLSNVLSYYQPVFALQKLAPEGASKEFPGLAALLTEKGRNARSPSAFGEFDPNQYQHGRYLHPTGSADLYELEQQRGWNPAAYPASPLAPGPDGRTACDPGSYESHFQELLGLR